MIGYDLGRRLRVEGAGAWYVASRPRGYRDAARGDAVVWRYEGGRGDLDFASLAVFEQGWLAARVPPPFAQVLARADPPPAFAMERIDGVPAQRLIDAGRALDLTTALGIAR